MRQADQWEFAAALLDATPAPEGRESTWVSARGFLESDGRHDAHLVASVLVADALGMVLLARHRRYGQWGPLGGHVDAADASLLEAATRELFEETSLAARFVSRPVEHNMSFYTCRTADAPTAHLDVCFVAHTDDTAPALVASGEICELGWFAPDALPTPLVVGVADVIAMATAARGRHPSTDGTDSSVTS